MEKVEEKTFAEIEVASDLCIAAIEYAINQMPKRKFIADSWYYIDVPSQNVSNALLVCRNLGDNYSVRLNFNYNNIDEWSIVRIGWDKQMIQYIDEIHSEGA